MKLTFLVLVTALFIALLGIQTPALFFVGYLWATILSPAYFTDWPVPLSFIFGCSCLLAFFFIDRSNRARYPLVFYVALALAIWVTLTSGWALFPAEAWKKWDWAFQSILLTITIPIFLRTRAQMETGFICVFAALSAHVLTAGIKTVLGTGGYDRLGRLMMTNFWLGETSTLALGAVISIPMFYYAVHDSLIFNLRGKGAKVLTWGYFFMALMCVAGTSARTGLVALIALCVVGFKTVWRKVGIILLAIGVYYGSASLLPQKTERRFSTISSYKEDNSAEIRLAAWRWAAAFARDHPFGGGFGAFNAANIDYEVHDAAGQTMLRHAGVTAPHSVYFEVLGEHGYLGLLLYLILIFIGLVGTWRISRIAPIRSELEWSRSFARSLFVCLVLFVVGSAFIGIAFQPLLFVFLGFYCSAFRLIRWETKPSVRVPPTQHVPGYV